jgi:nucleolysin TIA-1/TIAR
VSKLELATHYHIFVGDLSPQMTDEMLAQNFNVYPSMSYILIDDREARVMWDSVTGKSRGYGFVAFGQKEVRSILI